MSKTKISQYSQTASNNTDINSININEGCPPSTINNAIRELMKQIKDFQVGAEGDGLTVSSLVATTATLGAIVGAISFDAITATSANISGALTTTTANITTATIANVVSSNASITGGSISGITDLAVADGGTGRSTLTAENVLLGDGTNAVKFVAPGTNGNVLTSNGTTWTSAASPTFTLDDTKVPNVTAGTKYSPLTSAEEVGLVSSTSLTKICSARVLRTGTYNFRLRILNSESGDTHTFYSRIYANGSALGTEQSNSLANNAYATQTHSNISLTRGDIVQLYIRSSSVVNTKAYSWQFGVNEDIGFLPITTASTKDNLTSNVGLPL